MKAMREYFKSEKDFYEFVILHLDGEQRMNLLSVGRDHYRRKSLAYLWAKEILDKISDLMAIDFVVSTYRRMVGDDNAPIPGTEEAEEAKQPKEVITYVDDFGETVTVDKNAWVFQYLSKKGKNLDTLEDAIRRMSKEDVIERFPMEQWGITEYYPKSEMINIIFGNLTCILETLRKQEKEQAKKEVETIGNPIVYMIQNGEEALKGQLESMDLEELKDMVKAYHLDTARSYSRSNNPERLRQGIMARAITRATQGDTFFNYEN